MRRTFYTLAGKRLFDLVATIPAMIVFAPVLAICAALIRITSPGPAFFRQERLGRNARVFEALKFRTMTHKDRVPDTIAFSGDASEITSIGRVLRRFKLDELPQLINVLKGDMSLVGPRPQLPVQLAEFDDNARMRLLVRPGLTGMAQTHGNVVLTWPERWHYDADYVRRVSLTLDLWLIARTFGVLLHGEERYTVHPKLSEARS